MPLKASTVVALLPGEAEAIKTVKALGERYGYGNLINHLQDAWAEMLEREYNTPRQVGDKASGRICVWCGVDSRTGRKA